MKGVDDLDFYIGDEAIDKPTYSTKVLTAEISSCCIAVLRDLHLFCLLFVICDVNCQQPQLKGGISKTVKVQLLIGGRGGKPGIFSFSE